MGTEAASLNGDKAPPALSLFRARPRATRVVDQDDGAAASTPSLGRPVTVPFLWEDAPGKPKLPQTVTVPAVRGTDAAGTDGGGHDEGGAKARLMPLKLPPRLQVPSTAADHSLSPKTVIQGPYGCTSGARKPPRTALRCVASFRRTPSAGAGFFSRRKTDNKGGRDHDAAVPDTSYSSSSPSSSSSSSASFFGDDRRGHGARRWPGDRLADPEEDESISGSVRIRRFRRNRSLPSMTTSHLWASIRKSVKQIAPWS